MASRIGRTSSASRSSCSCVTYGCPVSTVTSIRSARATAAVKSTDAGRAPHSTWVSQLYEYGIRSAKTRCVSLASLRCSWIRVPV